MLLNLPVVGCTHYITKRPDLPRRLTLFIQMSIWRCYNLVCQLRGGTTMTPHSAFKAFILNVEGQQRRNSSALQVV